jgi:predicted amidophosphoribosyltransferase
MHPWRRIKRGTNPPATMAKFIGHELGLPALPKALRRRNSGPQKGLSRSARFRNMKNEMRTRAGYHLGAFRVLLIDDILTTGATCSEAARALKKAGAAEVTVLVVGRTPTN